MEESCLKIDLSSTKTLPGGGTTVDLSSTGKGSQVDRTRKPYIVLTNQKLPRGKFDGVVFHKPVGLGNPRRKRLHKHQNDIGGGRSEYPNEK